jgi:hypothetical protein
MHDLDRTYMEMNESFEFTGEAQAGEVFSESEVQELAAELLEVSNEEELNHFLGGLIKKAAGAVGKFVKSPLGQQLGGMLKGAAKKLLPKAGQAIGDWIAPGAGGQIGSQIASAAGSALGLELEGLSTEDREFEVAKQFVRFAADATKNAVSAATPNVAAAAQRGVMQAAEKFAPGLVGGGARPSGSAATSGRWIRRGAKIVLLGV